MYKITFKVGANQDQENLNKFKKNSESSYL